MTSSLDPSALPLRLGGQAPARGACRHPRSSKRAGVRASPGLGHDRTVLVVTRYTVPEQAGRGFYAKAKSAIKVLAEQPGYVRGRIGRATDEPLQWVIVTEWQNVGAYRRAIGTYTVRVEAVPFLALARDEPTAYEILYADNLDPEGSTAEWGTDRAADADSIGLGEAAGPEIETDL